jgi:hypothetical protein
VRGDRLRNLQQGLVPLRESFTGRCGMRFHRWAVWRISQSRLKRVWRMLKKPASIVLASFRSSAYPRGYASGPSLAAALLDGLFEHPAGFFPVVKGKA